MNKRLSYLLTFVFLGLSAQCFGMDRNMYTDRGMYKKEARAIVNQLANQNVNKDLAEGFIEEFCNSNPNRTVFFRSKRKAILNLAKSFYADFEKKRILEGTKETVEMILNNEPCVNTDIEFIGREIAIEGWLKKWSQNQ